MEERLFTHGLKPWEKVPESIHITMCHRERDEVSYVAETHLLADERRGV